MTTIESTTATYNNPVNPEHYPKTIFEPINIIEYYGLDYNLGSALAYILRWGRKTDKSDTTDLEKAIWYLKREVSNIKNPFDYERLLSAHYQATCKPKVWNYSYSSDEEEEFGV